MKMRSSNFTTDAEDAKRIELAADNRPSMHRPEKGAGVRDLQLALIALGYVGYMPSIVRKVRVDGDFGPETQNAVMAFQRNHGLKIDGRAGTQTLVLMDDMLFALDNPITAPPAPRIGATEGTRYRHALARGMRVARTA